MLSHSASVGSLYPLALQFTIELLISNPINRSPLRYTVLWELSFVVGWGKTLHFRSCITPFNQIVPIGTSNGKVILVARVNMWPITAICSQ